MKTESTKNFRRQNGSLYELIGNAFVHCYRNDALSRAPIGALIAAYRRAQDEE